MRWIFYGALTIAIAVVAAFAMMPVEFVMHAAQKCDPLILYSSAEGTVWRGEVRGIRYGAQAVGDARISTRALALLTGSLTSEFELSGNAVTGRGVMSLTPGGRLSLKDVRMAGTTRELISIQSEIRELNGEFRLDIVDAVIRDRECMKAEGRIWTNLLTRMESRWQWRGPELEGPISCQEGDVVLSLAGQNAAGEEVEGRLEVGLDATGRFQANVSNSQPETAQALILLGFLSEGRDRFVYQHAIPG
ncbi:MAG: hypothetical protein CMK06_14200 [Ponticaulis sp.]|nr:hypothetical protein [Ponticaulis sp.]|tara:strand:+ start:26261 stop:27004 length:744 start_codon:yes stop_codon:yes gene_type:complete